jgi:DNA-directed RNA polymerase specialized sigma24 family protein
VLILREVLEFPSADVARILDTTLPAVNSPSSRGRRNTASLDRE